MVTRGVKIDMKPVRDVRETRDGEHTSKTTVVHLECVRGGVELEHDDITLLVVSESIVSRFVCTSDINLFIRMPNPPVTRGVTIRIAVRWIRLANHSKKKPIGGVSRNMNPDLEIRWR